ncbi:MAG: hypothetical protein KBB83_08555 [Alphaproteobacteria bacterium]|nr:hypothetical protein [Alphaproteobacteria bacterium]
MIDLNPYAIPPLLCSIIILSAGFIVLFKKCHANLNQAFFLLCISTATWLSFYGINFTGTSQNPEFSQLMLRVGYCGVAFISITFMNYLFTFSNTPQRKSILVLNTIYGVILVFLILTTNLIVDGFHHFYWGHYPAAGKLHPYFLTIFLSQCVIANYQELSSF